MKKTVFVFLSAATFVLLQADVPSPHKVVIVTGASQGIGFVAAKKLAQEGYFVYGTFRTTSDIRALREAAAEYPTLIPLMLDVTDEPSIAQAVATIIARHGAIDVLINNACEVFIGTCETCTIEEQKRTMDVNYFGVVRMLQAILPHMRQQKSGHVINISSIAGFSAFPVIETYVATKFALEGLSESLASYLHHWNIAVTLVEPAGVKTKVTLNSRQGSRWDDSTLCFKAFCEKSHQEMKDGTDQFQDPAEIAELLLEIIKSPNPHLRYQTNEISRELAQSIFKDATGQNALMARRRELQGALQLLR